MQELQCQCQVKQMHHLILINFAAVFVTFEEAEMVFTACRGLTIVCSTKLRRRNALQWCVCIGHKTLVGMLVCIERNTTMLWLSHI